MAASSGQSHPGHSVHIAPPPLGVAEGTEQGFLQTALCDGKGPEWAGFSQPRPVEEKEKQMDCIAVLPTAPLASFLSSRSAGWRR